MAKKSVVFLDSGIGGLPYLEWVKKRHPEIALTYVADTRNFPYGELDQSHLIDAVVTTSRLIFSRLNPHILVVACNTASVAALEQVRSIAPCPVVGTIPALKTAALRTSGSIGLLATKNTVDSPYIDRLIKEFAPDRNIIRAAAGDIVRYVEQSWLDDGQAGVMSVMEKGLKDIKKAQVGSLVIGCTHFLHVINCIRQAMGNVPVIDSCEGVGERILSLLGDCEPGHSKGKFMVTRGGLREARYREFSVRFGLEWAGEIQ